MSTNVGLNVRFFEDGDENEVIKLVTSTFSDLNEDLWHWKYPKNPNFDRSLLFVVENSGHVIACMHYLPREIKINDSLNVKGALGADFAVHPDYRSQGIGSSMLRFSRSSKVLENRGIAVTYGFIDHRRAKFYRRNIDSSIVPLSTSVYKKYFDSSPIEKKLASLNKLNNSEDLLCNKRKKASMNIFFRLTGIPPFTLRINDGKFIVENGENLPHDITVEGYPYLLEPVSGWDKGTLGLIIGMLRGRIKIRGSPRKILTFYKIVKAMRRLSS